MFEGGLWAQSLDELECVKAHFTEGAWMLNNKNNSKEYYKLYKTNTIFINGRLWAIDKNFSPLQSQEMIPYQASMDTIFC